MRKKKYKSQIGVYCLCIKSLDKTYRYIGQTINLTKRLSVHKCSLRKGTHYNKFLQRVWNKYQNLEIKIHYCEKQYLTILEQTYINLLDNVVNNNPADAVNLLKLYTTAGPNNQCASKDIYKLYNSDTQEVFKGTVYNLSIKINREEGIKLFDSKNRIKLYSLISGRCKSFKGWCLYKNKDNVSPTITKNKIYSFKNKVTGEIVTSTRKDLCNKYNLSNTQLGLLIKNKITHVKSWTIYSPQ